MIRRLLLGAAVSAILFTVGVAALGWRPYVVMSESMAPAIDRKHVVGPCG